MRLILFIFLIGDLYAAPSCLHKPQNTLHISPYLRCRANPKHIINKFNPIKQKLLLFSTRTLLLFRFILSSSFDMLYSLYWFMIFLCYSTDKSISVQYCTGHQKMCRFSFFSCPARNYGVCRQPINKTDTTNLHLLINFAEPFFLPFQWWNQTRKANNKNKTNKQTPLNTISI